MNEKNTGRYQYGTDEKERMIKKRDAGVPVAEIAKEFGIPSCDIRKLDDDGSLDEKISAFLRGDIDIFEA